MATFTVGLTPALRNLATEGSLDTAVVGGFSIQRTVNMITVGSDTKIVVNVVDGGSFDDTALGLGDVLGITES
jgi:hypothetical protein